MKKYENEAIFRDTFLIHTKWRDSIKGLTQEQKGQLFKMMLNFH